MEWSIENFATPEAAETSRKKFTDSAGWTTKPADADFKEES
jgi:hypothetical protein